MSRWPEVWSCEEIRREAEAYLDGALPEIALTGIRSHLDGCPDCAAQVQLAAEIQAELQALPEFDAPEATRRLILDQASRSTDPRRLRLPLLDLWPRAAWPALAAAALAMALGLGVLHQRSLEAPTPDPMVLAQATDEARYALVRAGLLTRKAGITIRDKTLRDQVVAPASRGLSHALDKTPLQLSGPRPEGVDDV